MKHYIAFAAAFLSVALFLTAGCNIRSGQEQSQEESWGKKGGKGKMEQVEEIPVAPGEEEFVQKQEQKEETFEKTEQKQEKVQYQKQSQKM